MKLCNSSIPRGKSHGHADFKREKNNYKAESFLRLDFNVYITVENRARARERNKEQRRPISLEEKHEYFITVVRKSELLAATKVKISSSEKKKVNRNTYNISSIKSVTRKFLEKSRCSGSKQRQRNAQKSVMQLQFFFFTVLVVFTVSIFCLSKLQILKRAPLLALAKSIY